MHGMYRLHCVFAGQGVCRQYLKSHIKRLPNLSVLMPVAMSIQALPGCEESVALAAKAMDFTHAVRTLLTERAQPQL